MRAVMIIVDLDGHGTRRQCEIEPYSSKQPKGARPPGLLLPAVSQMTQLIVSHEISSNRLVVLSAEVKDQCHARQNMNWSEN